MSIGEEEEEAGGGGANWEVTYHGRWGGGEVRQPANSQQQLSYDLLVS